MLWSRLIFHKYHSFLRSGSTSLLAVKDLDRGLGEGASQTEGVGSPDRNVSQGQLAIHCPEDAVQALRRSEGEGDGPLRTPASLYYALKGG